MKINKLFYPFFALLFLLASCANNNESIDDENNLGNGSGSVQKITLTAEIAAPQNRMNFEDTSNGVKLTWEVGDVIRIYSGTTYAQTLTLTSGAGESVATFETTASNGNPLNINTEYRAIAMSADKLASLTGTAYPSMTIPTEMTQSGNNNMSHISDDIILTSVATIKYDGSENMGTFEFEGGKLGTTNNYAILATTFTVPEAGLVPTSLVVKNNAGTSSSKSYTLIFENMTANQPVTAYMIVPTGTLSNVQVNLYTNGDDSYQFTQGASVVLTAGTRYAKTIAPADWKEPGYYLSDLNSAPSIIANAKNRLIILDAGSPSISSFTTIRTALKERTEPIALEFPFMTSFPASTSASGGCFSGVKTITSISAPVATSIGKYAFNNCGLTSVAENDFPKVATIYDYAFAGSTDLATVYFPAATTMDPYAFSGCSGLKTANFPVMKTISEYSFYNCPKLATASFPMALNIKASAFAMSSAVKTEDLTIDFGSSYSSTTKPSGFTGVAVNVFGFRFATGFVNTNTVNNQAGSITLSLGQPFIKGTNPGIDYRNWFAVTEANTWSATSSGSLQSGDTGKYWWNNDTNKGTSVSSYCAWGPFEKIIITPAN